MKLWWGATVFWLVIFSIFAIVIGTRQIDGAGVVQTPEIRMVTFIILGVAFVFILMIQLFGLYFARKRV